MSGRIAFPEMLPSVRSPRNLLPRRCSAGAGMRRISVATRGEELIAAVAPLLPSPTLRSVAPATTGRGRKAGSLIKQKSRTCGAAVRASGSRSIDHDRNLRLPAMKYPATAIADSTKRCLTKHCSAASFG